MAKKENKNESIDKFITGIFYVAGLFLALSAAFHVIHIPAVAGTFEFLFHIGLMLLVIDKGLELMGVKDEKN